MLIALAALPILLILVLMLGAGWSAAKAGLSGLVAALLIAWLAFGYGTTILPELGLGATGGALLEAGFSAFTILWIIFPALCIHQLQQRSGALTTLQTAMARLSTNPVVIALLVAWFFALFIEGAAGFGTSAALAAPLLVSAGFNPIQAVTIALIGHSVGVSFGAVGTPVLPQIALGFDGTQLAAAASRYHTLLGWLMALIVVWLVTSKGNRPWGLALAAAAFFLVPYVLLAHFVGPELPTLGGALLGGLAFVALVRRKSSPVAATAPNGNLLLAAAPYLALVGLVLVTRLVPPINDILTSVRLGWELSVFSGSMQPLYHPGTLLLASFFIAALAQRVPASYVGRAMGEALAQIAPVTLALFVMLGLSRIMLHSGMITTLAEATANLAGPSYPLLAPFVGILGSFVTGSATASNILFSDFQVATASALNLPPLAILGVQNFGAAVGNIICPHNIIAAGATVSLAGQEGQVLRRTLGPALLYGALGGLLALLLVRL